MSKFKDQIFIFDLHNTLYDEVLEYGGAMGTAIDRAMEVLEEQGRGVDRDVLYRQIAQGHVVLGSDWDDGVWGRVEALQGLADVDTLKAELIDLRRAVSEELTKRYAYEGTLQALKGLKQAGAKLYLATEASANAAADGVRWLDLDGIVDGVYTWPFAGDYEALEKTRQFVFPPLAGAEGRYLQKPHAFILGQILLDIAKEEGDIPGAVSLDEVAEIVVDEGLDVLSLLEQVEDGNAQALQAVEAIRGVLKWKDGQYKGALQALQKQCFYVGDSFFKDGFLARNAGVPFIHAAYGKIVADEQAFEAAKEVLYSVTGWEPFLLQLTQEAGKLPQLTDKIEPHFTCESSFQEFVDYLKEKTG